MIDITPQNPLLTYIGNFDFQKFYTPKNRFLCHAALWVSYFILHLIHYYIGGNFSIETSFILSARSILNDMFVFYLFFYVILPIIFKYCKNITLIVVIIICLIPLCVYLWDLSNYLIISSYHALGIEISDGVYQGYVTKVANGTFQELFGFYKVIGEAMMIIFAFIVPFFVKVVFDIARLFSRNSKIQKQKLEVEIQNINIEKDFLKAQLNPHFLFNTLNNLYGLTVDKNKEASEVVLNLSDVMGYTLYESNTEKVLVPKELEFIENYFALEKMRYSEDKTIELYIDSQGASNLYIAPLLTFTFIENAFKYGLKSGIHSFLTIFISVSEGIFSFELNNDVNKTHRKEEETTTGGIGIENVRKRLQLLYPDRHSLHIEEKESKFHVSLQLNLN